MKIITRDFRQVGQQFSLWRVLQNTDDKTLQHLYRWLQSEYFLVPLLSKALHYPLPQPSHHSQKLIYLKGQAAPQIGRRCMILNNSSVSTYACIFHS